MKLSESFARSGFSRFINSRTGRITRIVVGIAMIIWGYTQLDNISGMIWILVGVIPLSAGLFDLCFISPLLGGPLAGKKVLSLIHI